MMNAKWSMEGSKNKEEEEEEEKVEAKQEEEEMEVIKTTTEWDCFIMYHTS